MFPVTPGTMFLFFNNVKIVQKKPFLVENFLFLFNKTHKNRRVRLILDPDTFPDNTRNPPYFQTGGGF